MAAEEYAWSYPQVIAALSLEPVGTDLATRVSCALQDRLEPMCYIHRDYCGHGLMYDATTRAFQVCSFDDGYPAAVLQTFNTREAFVEWLAEQSDFSLSGAEGGDAPLRAEGRFALNNQRITRERLRAFVAPPAVQAVAR
jgi:hypothetical protein